MTGNWINRTPYYRPVPTEGDCQRAFEILNGQSTGSDWYGQGVKEARNRGRTYDDMVMAASMAYAAAADKLKFK